MPEGELSTYTPPPYDLKPSLFARAQGRLRVLTATPRGAALVTVWAVAALVLAITAVPVRVHASDAQGALSASCGLDVTVIGNPDGTAETACRHALAGRSAAFLLASIVVLLGLVVAAGPAIAARLRTPRRAGLAAVAAAAAVVLLLCLRTVPVQIPDDGLSARCGIDTAYLGQPIDSVEKACRDATSMQAWLSVPALVALLGCGVALLRPRLRARSMVIVGCGAVAVVVAFVAARPLTVEVSGVHGSSMIVSCGIDTAFVGHDIDAVDRSCRERVGTHGAAFVGALVLSAVAATALARSRSEWRPA